MSKFSGSGCRIRGGLVAVLRCLDRSLNLPAPHVLLARLAWQGSRMSERYSVPRLKAAAFHLNHFPDPQGQPKSQIQVALIGGPCFKA